MTWNVFLQRFGIDLCQQFLVRIDVEPRYIDGEDDVSRTARAFGLEPLRQAFLSVYDVDFSTRLFRVGFDKRFDEEGLTMGINIKFGS